MNRIWAGAVAIACGLAVGFCIIWFGLEASEGSYNAGWAFLYVILFLPVLGCALVCGLVVLELFAAKMKWPRGLVIASGAVVPPVALVVFFGFPPLMGRLILGPNHGELGTPLMIGAFAAIPCLVTCLLYVLLARRAG